MRREQFLTVRWNNLLSLLLAIPAVVLVGVAIAGTASGFVLFIGIFAIGAVY